MHGPAEGIDTDGHLSFSLDRASLFLDLDGTLAPFTSRPDQVGPDACRNLRLRRLSERLNGRLAVVSGRPVKDLDRILEGAVTALAGSHGLQYRTADGRLRQRPAHPALSDVVEATKAWSARHSGTLVEVKPLSVALHYRGDTALEPEVHDFAGDMAHHAGLKLQKGVLVVELLTPGADKGQAVRAFMAESPFAGTTPVFVGDDLTDEDGFAAAKAQGGFGVLVGPPRPSAARFRLKDESAVHAWLEQALKDNHFVLECVA